MRRTSLSTRSRCVTLLSFILSAHSYIPHAGSGDDCRRGRVNYSYRVYCFVSGASGEWRGTRSTGAAAPGVFMPAMLSRFSRTLLLHFVINICHARKAPPKFQAAQVVFHWNISPYVRPISFRSIHRSANVLSKKSTVRYTINDAIWPGLQLRRPRPIFLHLGTL